MSAKLRASLVVVAVTAACDDIYLDPETEEAAASVVPPPAVGGDVRPPVEIVVAPIDCPVDRPRENAPCAVVGSSCEYGASADARCNVVLSCRGAPGNGYWEPTYRDADCFEGSCPASAAVAALDGQPCSLEVNDGPAADADEAICQVADGVCACTTGAGGVDSHPRRWSCVRPVSTSCPLERPRAGQSCPGSLSCDYGSCAFKNGLLMECTNGHWLSGGQSCP